MAKTYKGYGREQLIDILADFAVHTATVDNGRPGHGSTKNMNKADYVGLYSKYPMTSKKYPAFSLAGLFESMNDEIARAAEIASFVIPAAKQGK